MWNCQERGQRAQNAGSLSGSLQNSSPKRDLAGAGAGWNEVQAEGKVGAGPRHRGKRIQSCNVRTDYAEGRETTREDWSPGQQTAKQNNNNNRNILRTLRKSAGSKRVRTKE